MDRDQARDLLFDSEGRESVLLGRYRACRRDHQQALDRLRDQQAVSSRDRGEVRAQELAPLVDAPQRRQVDAAMRRWRSWGSKDHVEAAMKAWGADLGGADCAT